MSQLGGVLRRAGKSPAYLEVGEDETQTGQAFSSVLELNGWPVRLSIDDEHIVWSPVPSDDQCLPIALPSLAAKHKQVAVRDILCASIGEPVVHSLPGCCGAGGKYTVHRLVLHVLRRQRTARSNWRLVAVRFDSMEQEIVRGWATAINARVAKLEGRPSKLLVIVNPFGGAGAAQAVWERVYKRAFQPAGIKCEVVETQRQLHAHNLIAELTASQLLGLDGVVAVGGDGLFHEVVNGVMDVREQGGERALHAAYLRVGHIPAGSTDAVSCSMHGTRDEMTAALHIVVGDRAAVDVLRIDTSDGRHRYAITMAAYGYMGDLMRESEGLRWLGPLRYDLVGARTLLRGKTYRARVKYLPAEVQNADLQRVCGVSCDTCRQYRESSGGATNFMAHASTALKQSPERWLEKEGEWVAVMVLIPTCRSNKSLRGVAPFNHLSDGKALLVLVSRCNPLQYLQFLYELSKAGVGRGKFPFVEVVDVTAVQLEAVGELSSWNVDGELLQDRHLCAQVHGALVDVFARGPDVK